MKKLFALAILVVAFGALSGCSNVIASVKARLTSGPAAMKKALAAKSAARSWRMTTRLGIHDDKVMETRFEISCPDRERITTKIGSLDREMIRIGQRFYVSDRGTWYYEDVKRTDWSPCGTNSGAPSPWAMLNEGRDMLTLFASAAEKFKITRADRPAAVTCQPWLVSMEHEGAAQGGPSGLSYIVCLDENDLPATIVMGGGGLVTEYSDWNKPIAIEAPPNAVLYTGQDQQPQNPHAAPVQNPHAGFMTPSHTQ